MLKSKVQLRKVFAAEREEERGRLKETETKAETEKDRDRKGDRWRNRDRRGGGGRSTTFYAESFATHSRLPCGRADWGAGMEVIGKHPITGKQWPRVTGKVLNSLSSKPFLLPSGIVQVPGAGSSTEFLFATSSAFNASSTLPYIYLHD